MGPSGPRALLVWCGPGRVVICSRSPSLVPTPRAHAHTTASTRAARPTIAEGFSFLSGLRGCLGACLRPLAGGCGRVLEHRGEALEHVRGGAQLSRIDALQGGVPALFPGLALGLHLAPALPRQARYDDAPVGLRAHALDVAE